jgi:hypothetical protein
LRDFTCVSALAYQHSRIRGKPTQADWLVARTERTGLAPADPDWGALPDLGRETAFVHDVGSEPGAPRIVDDKSPAILFERLDGKIAYSFHAGRLGVKKTSPE